MINKDRNFFHYNSGDLVYIISPLSSQLRISSKKVAIKYIGALVIHKIIDPHNYLLTTLDGKILRGLLEHKRLKPAIIRTSQGSIYNILQLKQAANKDMTNSNLYRQIYLLINKAFIKVLRKILFMSEWACIFFIYLHADIIVYS